MAGRVTSPRVRFIDAFSRVFITVGGVGIIVAVLAIMAYLASNVTPLFKSGKVTSVSGQAISLASKPIMLAADEYRGLALFLLDDGRVQAVQTDSWTAFPPRPLIAGKVTATTQPNETGKAALALEGGQVQLLDFGFETTFLDASEASDPALKGLGINQRATLAPASEADLGSYVEFTPQRQYRKTAPKVVATAPVTIEAGTGPIVRLDFRSSSVAQYLVALRQDGTLVFNTVNITRPLGGGKPRTRLVSETIPFTPPQGRSLPDYLFAKDDGTEVVALWNDGMLQRYAKTSTTPWTVADTLDALPDPARRVTAARMLLGGKTIIVADDIGGIRGVFSARIETIRTPDGAVLVPAHTYSTGFGQPVTSLGISLRDRCFVIGDQAGNLTMLHMTSGKVIARIPSALSGAVALATVCPKLDGIAAISDKGQFASIGIDPGHPEASFGSLFGKVWYEGDKAPQYTYQASTGEDTAETKYSKVPLIFGTIKATIYAMLFAVPIAILAAIYTSEFLHPRVKNTVKPVIEMMASLPSVVLGFLAAIVIAPLFRDYLPGVLMAFLVLPVAVLTGAYLWQIVPIRITSLLRSWQHMLMVLAIVLVASGVAIGLGRVVQRVLFTPTAVEQLVMAGSTQPVPREQWPEALRDKRTFAADDARPYRSSGFFYREGALVKPVGSVTDPATAQIIKVNRLAEPDMRLWLDGTIGTSLPGWLLVFAGPGLIIASLLRSRFLDDYLQSLSVARVGTTAALIELTKFVLTMISGLVLAGLLAFVVTSMGLDARDSVLGSYSQRNTLVVGIVMGFAIIPIIYTISEDALSAVPGQLRSASLGCGATRWQTATRVVLPIALSGIFSAVMIGLGRAAGETMIVLMATGNTPDMSINIFSGFRTLAANIAVEMPEASKDSTHYYVLFLGALCLFALTFVVNTLAEFIRIRVRRKSAAL